MISFAEQPIELQFFDGTINNYYQSEKDMAKLLNTATLLAIFISCLGLIGLTAFGIQKRTKEIGIRRVLGASLINILSLISKDTIKLLLISAFVASPIAYYFVSQWLSNFAYRVEMSWWVFVVSSFVGCLIAFLTVSYQAIKAALMNPVKSLKAD